MATNHYNLSMVFERTEEWNFAEITVTPRMLRLLAAIDGRKSIAELEEELAVSYGDLFTDLEQLHGLRLIKTAAPHVQVAPLPSTKLKKVRYRGTMVELEKQTVAESDSPGRNKAAHYRGTAYQVAVGS